MTSMVVAQSNNPEPESWTRAEAIDRLRAEFQQLCGDSRSMCRVAAERGIFCRGFGRWPEREFHERWKGLLGVSTHLTRVQIERLADIWQLSEQVRHHVSLACDAQALCPGACRGWNEFSNADLGRFCKESLGRSVVVADFAAGEGDMISLYQDELGPRKPRRSAS